MYRHRGDRQHRLHLLAHHDRRRTHRRHRVETKRTIWQLGAIEVLDGGSDGDGDTAGGNTVFLRQGFFVP